MYIYVWCTIIYETKTKQNKQQQPISIPNIDGTILIRCISFVHWSQSSRVSLETRVEIIPFRGFHLNGQILDAISVVLYTFRDQYTLLIKIFHL